MKDNIIFILAVFTIPFILKTPTIAWNDKVGMRDGVTYQVYEGKKVYVLLVDGVSAGSFVTEELAKEYAEEL